MIDRKTYYFNLFISLINPPEVEFNKSTQVDWQKVVDRMKYMRTQGEAQSCIWVSAIVRDHLEGDLEIDPDRLQFYAVKDKRTREFWHVWTTLDSLPVEPTIYKRMYKFLYPLGQPDQEHEDFYQDLLKEGWREELRTSGH